MLQVFVSGQLTELSQCTGSWHSPSVWMNMSLTWTSSSPHTLFRKMPTIPFLSWASICTYSFLSILTLQLILSPLWPKQFQCSLKQWHVLNVTDLSLWFNHITPPPVFPNRSDNQVKMNEQMLYFQAFLSTLPSPDSRFLRYSHFLIVHWTMLLNQLSLILILTNCNV